MATTRKPRRAFLFVDVATTSTRAMGLLARGATGALAPGAFARRATAGRRAKCL
jgi:hypothetical protein